MKKIAIHQPQFLPYMGFFNKVVQADVYVVLDNIKSTKPDFTNRNKIKTTSGEHIITIPVKGSKNVMINEMPISNNYSWPDKHLKTLQTFYSRAPCYEAYTEDIQKIYKHKEWEWVIDIDMEFLKWLFDVLGISVEIIYSSDLNIDSLGVQRLVDICKTLDADLYISGPGGKKYLDSNLFDDNNIKLVFQNFEHPMYPQVFDEFIPNLSIIDVLFNCGEDKVREMIAKDKCV